MGPFGRSWRRIVSLVHTGHIRAERTRTRSWFTARCDALPYRVAGPRRMVRDVVAHSVVFNFLYGCPSRKSERVPLNTMRYYLIPHGMPCDTTEYHRECHIWKRPLVCLPGSRACQPDTAEFPGASHVAHRGVNSISSRVEMICPIVSGVRRHS